MQLICIPEAAALLSTRDKSPALKMCRVCISRLAVYWWHKQPYQAGDWFVSCLHLCVVLFFLLLLFCLIFTAFYFLSLSRVRH